MCNPESFRDQNLVTNLNQLLSVIDITLKGGAYIDPYLTPELIEIIRNKSISPKYPGSTGS